MLRTRLLGRGILAQPNPPLPPPDDYIFGQLYMVPDGYRAIVRDIHLFGYGAVASSLYLVVVPPAPEDEADVIVGYEATAIGANDFHYERDMVLEARDRLVFYSQLLYVSYYISGAELVLT